MLNFLLKKKDGRLSSSSIQPGLSGLNDFGSRATQHSTGMEQAESIAAAQSLNNYVKNGYNSYEQLLQLNGNYFPDCLTSHHHVQNHRSSSGGGGGGGPVRHLGHILSDKDPGSYENNNELSPAI